MAFRIAAALLAAAILAAAALEAFGLLGAYRDLRQGTEGARAAARELGTDPALWTAERVDAAGARAAAAQRLTDRGRARLEHDLLLAALRPLPLAGDQATSLLDLAGAASGAAAATRDAVAVAGIYRAASGGEGSPQRFLDALKQAQPQLADADQRLRLAFNTLNRDRARPLLPPLRAQLDLAVGALSTAIDEADSTYQVSKLAPAALGDPTPRTYLVIMANPSELRPDGGFAGVVGTMTFDHGAPGAIHLIDQYTLNDRYRERFPIPLPIQQHLVEAHNSLELGDAGWDPDLPSSAPLYERMWQSATGQAVDGTLIVDPYAIAALLRITGPVTVDRFGSFGADDFFTKLNILINAQGADKGTAVPLVAGTVLKAILSQPGGSYPKMASTLAQQARQRHLQIEVHDPQLQKVVAGANLDGAVRAPIGDDYVMVVDANVGATKGDAYVRKAEEIRVEKPASGLANHEVKLTYDFPPLAGDVDQKLNPRSHTNPTGAYRDYVRVYIPQEANLTGFQVLVDGKPASSNAVTENTVAHGKRVVGAYFELPPGHRAEVSMTYVTPLEPGSSYRLLVQKQAGRPDFPTSLWISYPGGQAKRRGSLTEDTLFEVRW